MSGALRLLSGAATVASLLVAWSGSPAAAQPPSPPLTASVVLDRSAPRAGELVTTDRTISGQAHALEGVRSVSLYVVPAGTPLDSARHRPESATPTLLSFDAVTFRLPWRHAKPRDVDLYVVARTLLREFSIVVRGVRVRPAPDASLPMRWVAVKARGDGPLPQHARETAEPDQSGLGVFNGGFDSTLPYATTSAAVRRPVRAPGVISVDDAHPRTSAWSTLSLGLVLLLGSAHVHRVLRSGPTPQGDR